MFMDNINYHLENEQLDPENRPQFDIFLVETSSSPYLAGSMLIYQRVPSSTHQFSTKPSRSLEYLINKPSRPAVALSSPKLTKKSWSKLLKVPPKHVDIFLNQCLVGWSLMKILFRGLTALKSKYIKGTAIRLMDVGGSRVPRRKSIKSGEKTRYQKKTRFFSSKSCNVGNPTMKYNLNIWAWFRPPIKMVTTFGDGLCIW